jgi:hypothetical protein
VFFNGAKDGQYATTNWLGGEYGGGASFPDTYHYVHKDKDGRYRDYADAMQYLNLFNIFSDLGPANQNAFDTEHYSLCGELSAMALANVGTRAGLHTFADLWFGPDILHNVKEGTTAYQLSEFIESLGAGSYRGDYGTTAETPPLTPSDIRNILKKDEYMLALVNMEVWPEPLENYGRLMSVDNSIRDTAHWVMITGILPTQDGTTIVRVYNPFNNIEEYYSWETFEAAWHKAGSVYGFYGYVIPE